MEKIDFKKVLKLLYSPPTGESALIEVPTMQFVKLDGEGDPNASPSYKSAVEWLYSVSYAMKFAAKGKLGKDYVVPPLEGLWWAADPNSFVRRDKVQWHWTMMIMAPDVIDREMFRAAVTKASKKLGQPPEGLRIEAYAEGLSLQTLHIGSYDDEGPVLARLHDELMPDKGMNFNGPHHEIYLGDPRKPGSTDPDRCRAVGMTNQVPI